MQLYNIVRHYDNGKSRTIRKGLSLAEAKSHCQNPLTSSSTAGLSYAITVDGKRYGSNYKGAWFDAYTTSEDNSYLTILRGEKWQKALLASDKVPIGNGIFRIKYHGIWYYSSNDLLGSGYTSLRTLKRRLA